MLDVIYILLLIGIPVGLVLLYGIASELKRIADVMENRDAGKRAYIS
jgi:hypothetical protein